MLQDSDFKKKLDSAIQSYNRRKYQEALTSFQQLVKDEDVPQACRYPAMRYLAKAYREGLGIELDVEKAELLEKKIQTEATEDNAIAQHQLGFMHEAGQGVLRNNGKALKWHRMAAELGNSDAQYHLGVLYSTPSQYVELDYQEAIGWLQRAAAEGQNHIQALCYLGALYEKGVGLAADNPREAFQYYEKAAQLEDAGAQCYLGFMYSIGRCVDKNYQLAFESFYKAAAQNHVDATYNLALMYSNGRGVPPDEVLATQWFKRASELGDCQAKARIEELEQEFKGGERILEAVQSEDFVSFDVLEELKIEAEEIAWQKTDVKSEWDTIFHLAARQGSDKMFFLLLKRVPAGVRFSLLQAKNTGKETPLHLLVRSGHIKMVKVLLSVLKKNDSGPDVLGEILISVDNARGYTPLHEAIRGGHFDIAEELMDAGAKIETLTNRSLSALQLATRCNYKDKFYDFITKRMGDKAPDILKVLRGDEVAGNFDEDAIIPYKKLMGDDNAELAQRAEVVGKGAYGVVYKYRWDEINDDVAIKALHSVEKEKRKTREEEFIKEARIMVQLKTQPNVVRLLGVSLHYEQQHYYMVMEFMPGGALSKLLLGGTQEINSWKVRRKICLDIARGLGFLHKEEVLHCDLKSENILLGRNYSELKLADFGISKVFQVSKGIRQEVWSEEERAENRGQIVVPGTPTHVAPELLTESGHEYVAACDVYSYGMTLWEIITRQNPYADYKGLSLIDSRKKGSVKSEKIGYNLTLKFLQEDASSLTEEEMEHAKDTATPILLKRGEGAYSIYSEGACFEEKCLEGLSEEDDLVLEGLDFQDDPITPLNISEMVSSEALMSILGKYGAKDISSLTCVDTMFLEEEDKQALRSNAKHGEVILFKKGAAPEIFYSAYCEASVWQERSLGDLTEEEWTALGELEFNQTLNAKELRASPLLSGMLKPWHNKVVPEGLPEALAELTEACLRDEPESRPSIQDIIDCLDSMGVSEINDDKGQALRSGVAADDIMDKDVCLSSSASLPMLSQGNASEVPYHTFTLEEKLAAWQKESDLVLSRFLSQVKTTIIEKKQVSCPSILISYIPSSERLVAAANILQKYFVELGLKVSLSTLSTAEGLRAESEEYDILMVLCTPAYAALVESAPAIREVIDAVGKKRKDALMPLLCEGDFSEVALKIVGDRYFSIRGYAGAMVADPVAALETFVDVILSLSGSQGLGLGVLPDILDLEKIVGGSDATLARKKYQELFSPLEAKLQENEGRYRLDAHLISAAQNNPLQAHSAAAEALSLSRIELVYKALMAKKVKKDAAITGVFLCASKADTLLMGLYVERFLLRKNQLALSIDCAQYSGKAAHHCVRLALRALGLKSNDIEALRRKEILIIFKNYEQLGVYDNLYVKNKLRNWPNIKVLVTVRADFFQHRGYLACFASDPATPRDSSVLLKTIAHFASPETEKCALSLEVPAPCEIGLGLEEISSAKSEAMQSVFEEFLVNVHRELGFVGKAGRQENKRAFISYAWELADSPEGKARLGRQQRHLSRLAHDLEKLGIIAWLDIERMRGAMGQQMSGNIAGSDYALVIGTPRYTQRTQQLTNVQIEYQAILREERAGKLKVYPLHFAESSEEAAMFPPELIIRAEQFDFRGIDDKAYYIGQLITLASQLLNTNLRDCPEYPQLQQSLNLLPATYLVTNKNQDLIQSHDIDNRLQLYIDQHALNRAEDILDTRFDLNKYFKRFLEDASTKSCVIFGKGGSGKSLFTLYTFKHYLQEWHRWRAENEQEDKKGAALPEWLPIYIALRHYPNDKAEKAIELALEDYGLDKADIEGLKQGLGREQKILFILDGYDELGKGNNPNYPNYLSTWQHAKLLISSRPEHFNGDSEHNDAFAVPGQYNSFKSVHISPFSADEIKRYVKAYEPENAEQVYAQIEAIPGLLELLSSPFLLNLVLQSLPEIKDKMQRDQHTIQRCDIYQAFIDSTFKKEAYKHEQILGHGVLLEEYHRFAEALAFGLFKQKTLSISENGACAQLWDWFSGTERATVRQACPLKRTGDEYSFMHKSLHEYFVAVKLWNNLHSDSSALSLESIKEWGTRNLVEERAIIDFLVEFYESGREEKDRLGKGKEEEKEDKSIAQKIKARLFSLVYESRDNPAAATAAANAITILNAARVPFYGLDLSNIHIPGADLSGAIADNVDFSKADLENVCFCLASLSGAKLQETNLSHIQFGELPYWKLNDECMACYTRDAEEKQHLVIAIEKNIRIYNIDTRKLLKILRVEEGFGVITSISSGLDGKLIASGSEDGAIIVWEINTGFVQQVFTEHRDCITSIAFSPDSKVLASGSNDNTIIVREVESGIVQYVLTEHKDCITSIAFSPDSKILASGSKDNTIIVWEVKSGIVQHVLTKHSGHGQTIVAFSPNGKYLASASWDCTILLWEIEKNYAPRTLGIEASPALSIAFSPDSKYLASGSWLRIIHLWGIKDGRVERTFEGHEDMVISLEFSSSGKQLLSTSKDKFVRLWRLEAHQFKQRALQGHEDWVTSIAFNPEGNQLASGSFEKTVRIWETKTGETKEVIKKDRHDVTSIAYSPNGKHLASSGGDADTIICLWKAETFELQYVLEGHERWITSIAFSPNGGYLASGSHDKKVLLWDVETAKVHSVFRGHELLITSVAFSMNGNQLASASWDCTIRLWEVETGKCQCILKTNDKISSIVFSPTNRKQLVSGGVSGRIYIWETELEQIQFTLQGHKEEINTLAFIPDGKFLASGGTDRAIRIWETATGKLLSVLEGHKHNVTSIAFSPDGKFLASGSGDKTIRLWSFVLTQPNVTQQKDVSPFVSLIWSSHFSQALSLSGVNSEGAYGLSLLNRELLNQRSGLEYNSPEEAEDILLRVLEQGNEIPVGPVVAIDSNSSPGNIAPASPAVLISTIGFFAESVQNEASLEEKRMGPRNG